MCLINNSFAGYQDGGWGILSGSTPWLPQSSLPAHDQLLVSQSPSLTEHACINSDTGTQPLPRGHQLTLSLRVLPGRTPPSSSGRSLTSQLPLLRPSCSVPLWTPPPSCTLTSSEPTSLLISLITIMKNPKNNILTDLCVKFLISNLSCR